MSRKKSKLKKRAKAWLKKSKETCGINLIFLNLYIQNQISLYLLDVIIVGMSLKELPHYFTEVELALLVPDVKGYQKNFGIFSLSC